MYLPRNATIEESCEWMEAKTGEKWTLPRLLEEAHLTPHVWIDHIPGYPQIFGERLEGYLTKMIFHGDVMRLAADRADALITMFPAHDGSLIKVSPGWRVALKDVRFNGQALERAAEILNGAKPAPEQASPAPVAPSASDALETEWHLLATAEQLCAAFGAFTGMNKDWFGKLGDKPVLKAARFQPGEGGRNKREPLFYVYPVLQWLIDERRKTGKPMQEATGWRMLKQHFPRVYEAYELSAPDPD